MRIRAVLLAPLLLVAAAVPGAEQPGRFTSGVWQGAANYDTEGNFSDCTMTAESDKGVLVGFVISKNFDWGIVIVDETRELDVGATQPVLLFIDRRDPIAAMAKVIDAHGVLIPLENSDRVIGALRGGKVLTIVTTDAKMSFKLTDTRDAIAALAACVTDHVGKVEL
jgi:hypothetical protein